MQCNTTMPRMAMHNTSKGETETLLPHEAARFLRISERTLFTLTQRGEVPHSRLNRMKRYSIEDLREFLRRGGTARGRTRGGAA